MKVDCNRPAGVFVHVHLGDLEGLRHLAIIVCTVSRHVVSRCAQDLCLAMYGLFALLVRPSDGCLVHEAIASDSWDPTLITL